jgi:predicted metal-dependent enzyme (double-stranded beta helix superfamily)
MPDHDVLLARCAAVLAEPEPRLAACSLLEELLADGALGYASGAPEPGIHVLHNAPDLTVLDVVWAPRSAILPHDHRMWAAIAIYDGREDNAFFRRDGNHAVPSGGKELTAGDVLVLGDQVVHGVSNPGSAYTGAIHVYGGDLIGTAPEPVGPRDPRGIALRLRRREPQLHPRLTLNHLA